MSNSDQLWEYFVKHKIIQKVNKRHKDNTKIFILIDPYRNRLLGLREPTLKQDYGVAFTKLNNSRKYVKNIKKLGLYESEEFRVFPTTFGEYFNKLKEKFGNMDLIIDPNDLKLVDLKKLH